MREHIPTFALVASLAMVLTTLVVLALNGQKSDGPVVIGLVGAVGTVVGVIGGFSQNNKAAPVPPPGMTSQKTETVIETPAPNGQTKGATQ